ncbi:MAG: hypothetical protein Q9165_008051 [Trypethelium subeluteriae]
MYFVKDGKLEGEFSDHVQRLRLKTGSRCVPLRLPAPRILRHFLGFGCVDSLQSIPANTPIQLSQVCKGFSIEKSPERVDRLEGRVHQPESRLGSFEGRFDKLEGRFENLEGRFDKLEGRFDKSDTRSDLIEAEVKSRFKGLEGRFTNMAAQEPWDDIFPVEYRSLHGNKLSEEAMEIYPDKLVKLWLLSRLQNHATLVSLLQFYDIGGWESWGYENRLVSDSDSESDDPIDENPTLATAVSRHPMIALRALVNRLGVNYERMGKRMFEWEADRLRRRIQIREQRTSEKRTHDRMNRGLGHRIGPNKISKPNSGSSEPHKPDPDKISTKSAVSEGRTSRILLKDLIGDYDELRPPPAPAPSSTRLEWKPPSSVEGPQQESHDSSKAASEGSTVPYTEKEMAELRRR